MHVIEKDLQETIKNHLHSIGYEVGTNRDYDRDLCLYTDDLIRFLADTQGELFNKYKEAQGRNWKKELFLLIDGQIKKRGIVDVLRNGIRLLRVNGTFNLLYPMPNTTLNPDSIKSFQGNIFKVTEEFIPSLDRDERIDLVISINGIPLIFLELKYSGTQSVADGIKQWRIDRDPMQKVYRERGLVFFAVDDTEVYMATKLKGNDTMFLPFNRGSNKGGGNPAVPDKFRTFYLWEDILTKETITDIIKRFYYIHVETNPLKKSEKKTSIFPRYHQLDCVRKILRDVKEKGCGTNYLIQHSAGSGKTNSITWLSHRLATLHDTENSNIFDSIIVVTDRKVLDKQLQDAISQLDKHSIVVGIDDKKKSADLAKAIESNKKVIITTIQKFPHALKVIENSKGKKYGVIIDEAHSSTAGETMGALRMTLYGEEDLEKEDITSDDIIADYLEKRSIGGNISFFAFTATPKDKTFQIFGTPGLGGKPHEFHLYSMKQAIEEGFILDVLKNYTTYDVYFKIAKKIEENPEFDKMKAKNAITKFINLNEYNIREKTQIIIDDFMSKRVGWLNGKSKGMVVTGSRLSAVKYKKIVDRYIREKGYSIKTLVAFSGKISYEGEEYTEEILNEGVRDIPKEFDKDEYKLLIVADKYQTGFDQPKLCAMYVDKSLGGVKCVQTLSRLNRRYKGKETFILDFVNVVTDIQDSFKPYYEDTRVAEAIDPNKLIDKYWAIERSIVYDEELIKEYVSLYFKERRTPAQNSKMSSILDGMLDIIENIEEEVKAKLKTEIKEYINMYKFLINLYDLKNLDFLRLYIYLSALYRKFPKEVYDPLNLDHLLSLDYYKLKKISEGDISIDRGEGELTGIGEGRSGKKKEEELEGIDLIISSINEIFGTNISEEDKVIIENMSLSFAADPKIQQVIKANTKKDFITAFDKVHFKRGLIKQKKNFSSLISSILANESLAKYLMESIAEKLYDEMK